MHKALRVTDRTVAKIAAEFAWPRPDVQAMMEHLSDGKIRPYAMITNADDERAYGLMIVSDDVFNRLYRFTSEEDPCMFTEVTTK